MGERSTAVWISQLQQGTGARIHSYSWGSHFSAPSRRSVEPRRPLGFPGPHGACPAGQVVAVFPLPGSFLLQLSPRSDARGLPLPSFLCLCLSCCSYLRVRIYISIYYLSFTYYLSIDLSRKCAKQQSLFCARPVWKSMCRLLEVRERVYNACDDQYSQACVHVTCNLDFFSLSLKT